MVQFNQLGCPPNTPFDLEVKNYGVSDIAAGLAVIVDTGNLAGASGTPLGIALPGGSTAIVIGVTTAIIAAGKLGKIRCEGFVVMTCSAALATPGTVVMADSAGKCLTWTTTNVPCGVTYSAASATGESVLVKFYGGQPATSAT